MRNIILIIKTIQKVGFRSYTYPIFLLVALLYGGIIRAFPKEFYGTMLPIILFLEPTLLGFTFVGVMIFLEKRDNTISALSVVPLNWRDYYLSKALLMGVYSLLGALIILFVGVEFRISNLPLVLLGVFLSSIVYTFIGIGTSSKYKSLDEYFLPLIGILIFSFLPFFHYYKLLGDWAVFTIVIPSYPTLYFLTSPFKDHSFTTLILSLGGLVFWIFLSYFFAQNRFYKNVLEGLK